MKVIVCTKAFGMGIDQPDVDVVVRIGCPQSIEDMVQEFGRAGRDGRRAKGKKLMSIGMLALQIRYYPLFNYSDTSVSRI